MPQLDGVSATAMIRDMQPHTPIIAMTSNINQQDLEMYFQWGKLSGPPRISGWVDEAKF